MQQLLDDPQTINFFQSNQVHLHILKKEIDRRVDKIKQLIKGTHPPPQKCQQHARTNTCTQTQNNQQNSNLPERPKRIYQKRRVLSSHNSNMLIEIDQNQFEKGRPSLPSDNKNGYNNRQSFQPSKDYNKKIKVSDYLTSKKASFIGYSKFEDSFVRSKDNQQMLLFIKDEKEESNHKLFECEFQYHDSFKNIEQIVDGLKIRMKNHMPVLNNLNTGTEHIFSDSYQLDNSESEINRKSFSTITKKHASNKKTKMTQRTTLTQNQKRIIFSDECKENLLLQLNKNISKKRKQTGDNKLRANIIKKIEEKYEQFFDNI